MGGALQLLLELQYISGALQQLKSTRDNALETTKGSLLKKIKELSEDPKSRSFDELNTWCQSTGGTNAGYRADVVSRLKSVEAAQQTRFNTSSFKA